MMRFVFIATLLILCYNWAFAASPLGPGPLANIVVATKKGDVSFTLEVAATPEQRKIGLMNRSHIGLFDGMIFLFPEARDYDFWMSNTYIGLDMLFLDEFDTIVHIEHDVAPQSLVSRSANRLVKTVIELPGGTARAENIRVGDHVTTAFSQPVEVR